MQFYQERSKNMVHVTRKVYQQQNRNRTEPF